MNCGIRLVSVQMKRTAAREMQNREGVKMVVVATAYDRPPTVIRHDERQRRGSDLPGVNRDSIFGRHVQKHATEPVVGNGRDQVRHYPELRAAERRRDGVAAERNGVRRRHVLLVAGRHPVGQKGNVNIGLSNEESLHDPQLSGLPAEICGNRPRRRHTADVNSQPPASTPRSLSSQNSKRCHTPHRAG
jgi:hypothetical protein